MEDGMYHVSIEREGLRNTKEGTLSDLPHPNIFGDKNKNSFITTGLCENQLKIKTPMCQSISECYEKLENLTDIVLDELDKRQELLWPCSMPCNFNNASYMGENYKSYICINFSIDKIFYKKMLKINKKIPKSINEAYIKIAKIFTEKSWFIGNLLNATIDNKKSNNIIALKEKDNQNDMKNHKINHIEISSCDINPFEKCGINQEELELIVAFLFNCLINEEKEISNKNNMLEEFEKIKETNKLLDLEFTTSIEKVCDNYKNGYNKIAKLKKLINEKGYINGILDLANKYTVEAENAKYSIKNCPNVLASTVAIVKAALLQGIDYKILNFKEYDCFVEFINGKHKEYVIGGTRTNKDSYIFPYITDDKYFAKQRMSENRNMCSKWYIN